MADSEPSGNTPLTGTLASATSSGSFVPVADRDFNLTLSGTFVATLRLDRSFDRGVTWFPLTYIDGSALTWTAPMSSAIGEDEAGVYYRLTASSYTSGTVTYRISQ